jgi:hypothetical protein
MTGAITNMTANAVQWIVSSTTSTTSTTYAASANPVAWIGGNQAVPPPPSPESLLAQLRGVSRIKLSDWFRGTLELADGARLVFDDGGNYRIEDQDARVTYKANRVRTFNRYINASDLLEEFVTDCLKEGISKQEFMNLPVDLLIRWLVVRAAEADGERAPEDYRFEPRLVQVRLPPPPRVVPPRCLCCGRFNRKVKHEAGVNFVDEAHLARFMDKRSLRIAA